MRSSPTHTYIHTHTYVHTYANMHMHANVYTHTQTLIHRRSFHDFVAVWLFGCFFIRLSGIVDMHGGTLTVHSAGPGCGCTFTIEIPLFTPSEDANIVNDSVENSVSIITQNNWQKRRSNMSFLLSGVIVEASSRDGDLESRPNSAEFYPNSFRSRKGDDDSFRHQGRGPSLVEESESLVSPATMDSRRPSFDLASIVPIGGVASPKSSVRYSKLPAGIGMEKNQDGFESMSTNAMSDTCHSILRTNHSVGAHDAGGGPLKTSGVGGVGVALSLDQGQRVSSNTPASGLQISMVSSPNRSNRNINSRVSGRAVGGLSCILGSSCDDSEDNASLSGPSSSHREEALKLWDAGMHFLLVGATPTVTGNPIVQLLTRHGHVVTLAESGEEFLTLMHNYKVRQKETGQQAAADKCLSISNINSPQAPKSDEEILLADSFMAELRSNLVPCVSAMDASITSECFNAPYDVVLIWDTTEEGPHSVRTVRGAGYRGLMIGLTLSTTAEDEEYFMAQGLTSVLRVPLTLESIQSTVIRAIAEAGGV